MTHPNGDARPPSHFGRRVRQADSLVVLIEVLVAGVRVDTVEEGGVKQTRTTVTYRFSQPDQPMPLVLPQSYSTGRVIRIPAKPQTVGDHIRKRRLSLKLFQKDVAEQIGVEKTSIANWERNRFYPGDPLHASDHRLPRVRPTAAGKFAGRAVGPPADEPWAFAGGVRQAAWRGPQYVGEVGAGKREPVGVFSGAGDEIPPRRRRSGRATCWISKSVIWSIVGAFVVESSVRLG